MQHDKPNGKAQPAFMRCPVCGSRLDVSLLEVPSDDDDAEIEATLLLLDCPTGDYHGTFTQQQVTRVLADETLRRWREGQL